MKPIKVALLLCSALLFSCTEKNNLAVNVKNTDSDCITVRLDSVFYSSDIPLKELRIEYPTFFSEDISDSLLEIKRNDEQLKAMAKATFEKFATTKEIKKELDELFKHVKYYYPQFETPKVFFFISDWNFTQPISYIPEKNELYIALNLYLSYSCPLYSGIYDYWRMWLDQKYLNRDVAYALANYFVPYSAKDTKLVEMMVYNGKLLYLTNAFVPNIEKNLIFHYDKDKLKWAEANEDGIWSYFVTNQMLYKSDKMNAPRFFDPAPFSKFYLELDNESPPQLGAWLGYRIIEDYMKNNPETSIKDMLQMDGIELFQNSKYKPKRN